MLTPYRRHLNSCPHREKGQHFSLCACPVWAYGTLPSGEGFRKSLQTNDWIQAEHRISVLSKGGEYCFLPEVSQMTVGAAMLRFLGACKDRNLRVSTLESYARTLESLESFAGVRALSSIDANVLDSFRAGRRVAPRTWRKELETLRAFFAWCLDRRWTQDNPARRLKMPRVDEIATLPLTGEEVQKLLAACDRISSDDASETTYIRKRARCLVFTLLYSGLRISDVTVLRRSTLNPNTGHLTLKIMKTGAPLKVLLHQDAVQSLVSLPAANPEFFFWTGRGDPVTCTKNMRRTIQRLGTIAGVRAHPHRFRDTFAVELLTNGADIRTVQLLLGHTSVRTTEKHYAHFVAAHQRLLDSAAATLDFGPRAGRPLLVKTV